LRPLEGREDLADTALAAGEVIQQLKPGGV